MAHELNTVNGKASMAYTGEAPWHRLGTAVAEAMTAADAIRLGGLAYDVLSLPCYAEKPDGGRIEIPDTFLNVRADTFESLGRVSNEYKVVQNHEAFAFLDSLVGSGDLRYHTVGALGKGERIWMLGKVAGEPIVLGQDVTEKYLLLYNSHNGSSSLRVIWTPVRVVCWNTLSAALRAGEGTGVSIRHTGEIDQKLDEARRVLGLAHAFYKAFGEGAALLYRTQIGEAQIKAYFESIYPGDDRVAAEPEQARPWGWTKGVHHTLRGLLETGKGSDLPGVKGTAWAAYNSITEYIDHIAGRGKDGTVSARRLGENWMGGGARIKRKAFENAVLLAEKPHAELPPASADAGEPEAQAVAVLDGPKPRAKGKKAPQPSAN